MTKRDVFSLAVKIIGIWTLVMGAINIPSILLAIPGIPTMSYPEGQTKWTMVLMFLVPTLLIPLGAFLLYRSDSVSSAINKNDVSFSLPGWLADKNQVFQFALVIAGLVLLVQNIPILVYNIYSIFRSMFHDGVMIGNAFELSFYHIQAFQAVIGVAIGAYLLFCKKGASINLRGEKRNDK